jgi:cyclophilin family peptidyl-prolyl cis-trans isomerase
MLGAGLALLLVTGCERRAWDRTAEAATVAAYQQYLKDYPEGKHVDDAWSRIEQLRLQQAQRQNTLAAYEAYLQEFPHGQLHSFAVDLMLRLTDPQVRALTPDELDRLSAEIETSQGAIRFRFFGRDAPETCRNFIKLARAHFYDGLLFHRVLSGQLIQAGAPQANPSAGPGYTIKPELNGHPHVRGAVAMHHDRYPDSAGSQFYICLADLPERNDQYTVFGQVTEGIEVVEAIGRFKTNGPEGQPFPDRPLEDLIIQRVRILTPTETKP